MTTELTMLALSIVLGLAHLVLSAQLSNYHRGYVKWAAGARDQPAPPLPPVPARVERAYRNFIETFPLFAAAVAAAHLSDTHGWMTLWGVHLYFWARLAYLPIYAAGVWLLRSLVWNVAFAGIVLILLAMI